MRPLDKLSAEDLEAYFRSMPQERLDSVFRGVISSIMPNDFAETEALARQKKCGKLLLAAILLPWTIGEVFELNAKIADLEAELVAAKHEPF